MNQTYRFKLSQWDRSDRIQMEDFNADNAKIEAALVDLDKRAGSRIWNGYQSMINDGTAYTLPMLARWDEASLAHAIFDPITLNSEPLVLELRGEAKVQNIGTMIGNTNADPTTHRNVAHLLLFPGFNKYHTVTLFATGMTPNGIIETDIIYDKLSAIYIYARTGGNKLLAGSAVRLYTKS